MVLELQTLHVIAFVCELCRDKMHLHNLRVASKNYLGGPDFYGPSALEGNRSSELMLGLLHLLTELLHS
jgi:hypothetical protein